MARLMSRAWMSLAATFFVVFGRGYAAATRRALPRNTSLVFQVFWGLLFGAIALAMR